jgi:hypothetical protein
MAENVHQVITTEAYKQSLVNLAVESWRFGRVFDRMLLKLDAVEQARYQNQYRWFVKKVDESLADVGLNIVNVEGQMYDPGIAATPLNIGEFGADDKLYVEQMIEPIIMSNDGLVRSGTVMLKKVVL